MFYDRKKRCWVVQVRDASGRRSPKRRFKRREDAIEAESLYIRTRQRVRAGLERLIEPKTFSEFVRSWMENRKRVRPKSTTKGEEGKLNATWYKELGSRKLHTIRSEEISGRLQALYSGGISAATRNLHRALLHTIFEDAKKERLVLENPIARIPILPTRRGKGGEILYWKKLEDSERYLIAAEEFGKKYVVLGNLLLWAGLRIGEALALQWGDIDFEGKQIHVRRIIETVSSEAKNRTKGDRTSGPDDIGEGRLVPLFPRVLLVLREFSKAIPTAAPSDFIVNSGAAPLTYWKFVRVHRRIMKKAGLVPLTPHQLRHTFASNAEKAGYAKGEIQRMLGHASITTTEIYTHVDVDHLLEKARRIGFASGLKLIPGGGA